MNYELWRITSLKFLQGLYSFCFLLVATACTLDSPSPFPGRTLTPLTSPEVVIAPNLEWEDLSYTVNGVCFDAAEDAEGQIFILRSAQEHIRFYDGVDQSGLCRRSVERHPINFDGGYVLAGLWSMGRGCTARHNVATYIRHDEARLVVFNLKFITEGDCPYDLIRPFFVGLPAASDYEITFLVETANGDSNSESPPTIINP